MLHFPPRLVTWALTAFRIPEDTVLLQLLLLYFSLQKYMESVCPFSTVSDLTYTCSEATAAFGYSKKISKHFYMNEFFLESACHLTHPVQNQTSACLSSEVHETMLLGLLWDATPVLLWANYCIERAQTAQCSTARYEGVYVGRGYKQLLQAGTGKKKSSASRAGKDTGMFTSSK